MIRRRQFLRRLVLAGAGAALAKRARPVGAEPPPEVSTIRLIRSAAICIAPQYVAEELLRAEGFAEVRYVEQPVGGLGTLQKLATGGGCQHDVQRAARRPGRCWRPARRPGRHPRGLLRAVRHRARADDPRSQGQDRGRPGAPIEPAHLPLGDGCVRGPRPAARQHLAHPPERREHPAVRGSHARRLHGLPARTSGTPRPPHRPRRREQRRGPPVVAVFLLHARRQPGLRAQVSDRHLAGPARRAEGRRRVRRRARARAAQILVDRGHTRRYDYALQTLREVPYVRWREYDPEDTLRFYALRLHEVGMIQSTPQKILAQGTDWRILNELRKELKG